MDRQKTPYIRAYQTLKLPNYKQEPGYLVKLDILLEDKPGSLADFSFLIAEAGGNIGFFHYDRSIDPNRVVSEVQFKERENLEKLLQLLKKSYSYSEDERLQDDIKIITPESVLEIKVRLTNRPGSLAAFACHLKEYRANVIYMLYNEDIDPESANIALATENPDEVNTLLSVINNRGYNYKVVYRGSDTEEVERIIGLKLVEKFFLRLRKLVSDRDVKQLMAIVDSSRKLYSELVNFYSEVGNHPEKGDVFSNVLAFASTSIVRLGKNFKAKQLTPLQFNTTRILTFCLPTGGNIFVFQHDDEFTMFDAGYGLYYEDFKSLLVSKRINPSRVKRIFVSHADADHIGCAGYFSEEFGAQVFIHPDCKGVMDKENRGYGANTQLSRLNKHFTMLVNRFTQCKYPKNMNFFPTEPLSKIGVFNIIHTFRVGSLKFEVLESQGGHVPGQVFFLNREHGLIFTSDYLINVESLSDEEREYLKLPRYLMTSTNTNSQLFREESKHLIEVIFSLNKKLKEKKSSVIIFPGHGNYYSYQEQFSIC